MKAYEIPAKRFIEIASPELLRELETHSRNFTQFNRDGKKDLANKALMRGKIAISKLQAVLREMEDVGESLEPDDKKLFFHKIAPTKQKALSAIQEFQNLDQPAALLNVNSHELESESFIKDNQHQILAEKEILLEKKTQLEEVESLQRDIVELNELFVEVSKHVESQREVVSAVENNVENTLDHVKEGVKHLEKAAKLKTAFYPLTGALLGTCIGGPVGLIAGLKLGALTALGGTVLGFTGGRLLKKSQEESTSNSTIVISQSMPASLNSSENTAMTYSATSGAISKNGKNASHFHKD